MPKVSESAVRAAAARYWTALNDVNMAVEIGRIESGFDTHAYNGVGRDRSYGVMQVNMKEPLGAARRQQFGLASNEQLWDLDTNMRVAHGIWLQNGRSFFGSAAWSTSAVTAAAKLSLTGQRGQDDDDNSAARDAAIAKLKAADEAGKFDGIDGVNGWLDAAVFVTNEIEPESAQVIAAAGLTADDVAALRSGTSDGLGDLTPLGGPNLTSFNPLELAGKFLSVITDPTFWKRIGLGALGAAVIIIGIILFTKNQITSTAKDAISE